MILASYYTLSPMAQVNLMKRAIDEIVQNNALELYDGPSNWSTLTFGVPKKNEGIRIVSDFMKLYEAIRRNPWPMPTIQDMPH